MDDIDRKITEDSIHREGIDPRNEGALLKCLRETKDPHLIWNVTIMLQAVGTERAIPSLKELMYFPKTDIKITSFGALTCILKDDGQNFYIETLENSKYPEKFSVITAINEYCDARAAMSVLARVKKIVKGKRKAVYYYGPMTELTTCLKYLTRVDTPEKEEAYQVVRDKVGVLDAPETEWIKENIPGLL